MLFQKTIIKKYLTLIDNERVSLAWKQFQAYFLDAQIQANIQQSKEEQFQEGFLRELFVKVLGYTLNPSPNFNLITEKKNETNSKKADGAIQKDNKVIGVIELKDHKTTDLSKVEPQAFNYKSQHPDARYVVISNFEKLRLYIDNAVEYREWNLFHLTEEDFRELFLCLAWKQVERGVALQMKQESVSSEDQITKALYKDYSQFKRVLFANILKLNPTPEDNDEKEWQLLLFKKTQKLLDRLLFIFFAEDCGLLPPNSMVKIIDQWESLKEMDEYRPFYDRVKKYFGYMNTGYQGKKYEIFAYNGGLFKPDEILDNIKISDDLLVAHTRKLSEYDFESDVDVNILGHIFENSLSEIEEVTQQINNGTIPQTSKRKQDGVFYTPQYITKYIVENTVGRLCAEKKQQLNIVEDEYFSDQRRQMQTKKRLLDQLHHYRDWLLQITILDPACGSGAFLNAALQFLMAEHKLIDEMEAKVAGSTIVFQDVENSILEHNLYGVDINEESVEIAQLALWLRTAKPHRKLNSLNENIKCGNSLISDPAIAGEKAFNWQEQFPKVFEKGGFDVVIGNPPYIPTERITSADKSYYEEVFQSAYGRINVYPLFYERGLKLLKNNGLLGYITPYTLMKNQYYIEARRYILDNCTILCLADFSGFPVFEDATVDSIILILQKQHYKKAVPYIFINHIKDFANGLYSIHEALQSDILQHSDLSFSNIVSSFDFKKVSVGCVKLGEIVNFKQGIITGNNKKFLTKQEGDKTKKVITGSDFNRYALTWHNDYVIYDEKELHRPRVPGIFEVEQKLLLRQTGAYPICMIDTNSYYTLDTVHNGTLIDKRFNLKYIMCLVNSTLHRYLYESSVNESGKVFAQVKIIYIDPLPIKVVDEAIQQPFVTLAETMLSLNQQLLEKRTRFLRRLSENFDGIKITTALQTFEQLDFKGFVAELKKQKIKLTLVQQDEWEDYFNQYRQACQELSEQIKATDNEIDNKVFDLYGLTPEEREIVLNN